MKRIHLRVSVLHLPPEGERLEGELSLEQVLGSGSHDSRVRCPYSLVYALRVSPVHGGIIVRGMLSTVIVAECDRCLESFRLPLEGVSVCWFYEVPENGVLDLTEDVREDMLLAFPDYFLCREDCRGLCPICGRNRNHGDCGCVPAAPEPRNDVWGALERLPDK